MSEAAALATELDGFEKIIADLRAIASRVDPERRAELIALRRQLATQIAQVREVGLRAFHDPAISSEFRSRLSRSLNLMALHQAKWPAVAIDQDDVAYRHSAQQLADANRGFIDWTRARWPRLAERHYFAFSVAR